MGTTTTETNQQSEVARPPRWAQPAFQALGQRIGRAVTRFPGERYMGDFIAQPTGADRAVPGMYADAARLGGQLVNPAMGAIRNNFQMPTFGGPGLSVDSFAGTNPAGMEGAVNAATAPVFRQLQEQVMPNLQSSALEAGAYGGNRSMEVLPAQVIRDYGRQAQEIAAGLAYEDFQAKEQRELEAYGQATQRGLGEGQIMSQRLSQIPSLLDTAMRMQTGSADLQAQAAGYQRMLKQLGIDNTLQQHDYNIRYPFQGMDVAAALLGQIAAPWGSKTSWGQQSQTTGGAGPILQGALGAGMMAMGYPGGMSSMFQSAAPAVAASNWVNPAITSGAYFSDRRLKRDLKQIGHIGQLPVYSYRYLWSPSRTVGVMADDVERLMPEALGPSVLGFKTVDYSKLGVC